MNSRAVLVSPIIFSMVLSAYGSEPKELVPDMIDVTLSDTFESGELNAWESYPIAEDPGFDPEICCVQEPAYKGSSWSLAKVKRPNDTDYPRDDNRLGMTKKIRLWTGPETELSVAVFLDGDRKAKGLKIILYSSDGRRFVWSQAVPPANAWIPLRVPMSGFTSGNDRLVAGKLIEAVTVMASYGPVDPHRSYSICIDDFELRGQSPAPVHCRRAFLDVPRQVFLQLSQPPFCPRRGGGLESAREAGNRPATLTAVSATVYDSRRNAKAKDVPLSGSESGTWESGSLYRIGENDPAGQWRIDLKGTGTNGEFVRDELFFLVPEQRFTPQAHPRLFFSTAELSALKADRDPKREKVPRSGDCSGQGVGGGQQHRRRCRGQKPESGVSRRRRVLSHVGLLPIVVETGNHRP